MIKETQTSALLKLEDADLVKQLVGQMVYQKSLSEEEAIATNTDLRSKTSLIQAIAHSRRCG